MGYADGLHVEGGRAALGEYCAIGDGVGYADCACGGRG